MAMTIVPGFLRARWRRWWLARHPAVERWTLSQRNLYIVPTRAGVAFVATVGVLLLASINYQLNLGYALTFLLAGSALASMHMTHASLRGLTLHLRPVEPATAGADTQLELVITNPTGQRHGVGVRVEADGEGTAATPLAWADIPAQSQSLLQLRFPAGARGRHGIPPLRAESRFPFGLFRAWTIWRPAGQRWVYPAMEQPTPDLPAPEPVPGGGPSSRDTGGSEFDGLRPWRRGDALRQVVWKKVARTGELISRESHTAARQQLWLSWAATRLPETEARLSRLAAWAHAAESQGLLYGLRLPGQELPLGEGPGQLQAALQALAEWD
jgi:uncharacterized protein (DUF58 family)